MAAPAAMPIPDWHRDDPWPRGIRRHLRRMERKHRPTTSADRPLQRYRRPPEVPMARDGDLEIAVRGGGHNLASTAVCDDGIVIDLSAMRALAVDPVGGRPA